MKSINQFLDGVEIVAMYAFWVLVGAFLLLEAHSRMFIAGKRAEEKKPEFNFRPGMKLRYLQSGRAKRQTSESQPKQRT